MVIRTWNWNEGELTANCGWLRYKVIPLDGGQAIAIRFEILDGVTTSEIVGGSFYSLSDAMEWCCLDWDGSGSFQKQSERAREARDGKMERMHYVSGDLSGAVEKFKGRPIQVPHVNETKSPPLAYTNWLNVPQSMLRVRELVSAIPDGRPDRRVWKTCKEGVRSDDPVYGSVLISINAQGIALVSVRGCQVGQPEREWVTIFGEEDGLGLQDALDRCATWKADDFHEEEGEKRENERPDQEPALRGDVDKDQLQQIEWAKRQLRDVLERYEGDHDKHCECSLETPSCDEMQLRAVFQELGEVLCPSPSTLRPERLNSHAERVYFEEWQRVCKRDVALNSGWGTLEHLIGGNDGPRAATRAEAQAATAVVQWLGTNVGGCWLRECERKIDEGRELRRLDSFGKSERPANTKLDETIEKLKSAVIDDFMPADEKWRWSKNQARARLDAYVRGLVALVLWQQGKKSQAEQVSGRTGERLEAFIKEINDLVRDQTPAGFDPVHLG